jgi:hypothetical protein
MAFGGMAMKFLRSDSGQVLIFRTPSSRVGKAETAQQTPVVPASQPANAAPQAVGAVTSHCCFICQWCASPILLPHDQMGLPFAHPSLRSIEVRTVAAICASCHHIASYSLFRACPGFDTRHKLMPAPTAGTTILLEWLRCDMTGCQYKVPLFVNFDSHLSDKEKLSLIAKWVWHNLTCTGGHRIPRPASIPRPDPALVVD